jgi:hypothetical protein
MTDLFFDIDIRVALSEPQYVSTIRQEIQNGAVGVVRQFLDASTVAQLREYLSSIGRSSIPTYEPIDIGKPNFHRLNYSDERAHVKGCFHQFVFYPWNQDVFNLFALLGDLFRLKNLISRNPQDRFLGRLGENGMISRIAIQFYPSGKGFLNRHQDPTGDHQLTVPTIVLSDKSSDFIAGGAFIEDEFGYRTYLDDYTSLGDVVFFDSRTTHGVELIDPGSNSHWLDFKGRWSCLIATNKVASNDQVNDAIDLGEQWT